LCLTDLVDEVAAAGVEAIELPQKWPGWFSKLNLWAPGLLPDGPTWFADLDTIIVGPLDDIVLGHTFTVLQNFWSKDRIGSGLMAWSEEAAHRLGIIYERFAESPAKYVKEYVTKDKWGDQGFIRFNTPIEPERWQAKFPSRVVSYKRTCIPFGGIPPAASVVCFHGIPRPWNLPVAHRRWFDVGFGNPAI
jgi:hypothetical protein